MPHCTVSIVPTFFQVLPRTARRIASGGLPASSGGNQDKKREGSFGKSKFYKGAIPGIKV